MITALLSISTCLKNRIIVSAPTNRAVSELSERFLTTLGMEQSVLSQISAFASPAGNWVQSFGPLHIGDVLLVGNEDRLDTDGVLGGIFLQNRTERLAHATAPATGWQHSAQLVLDYLSSNLALAVYEEYAERWEDAERPCPTFLKYMREVLNGYGRTWIESGRVLCVDLPSKVLNAKARGMLGASCDVMENFLKMLNDGHVSDEQARHWFSGKCKSSQRKAASLDRRFLSAKKKLVEIMESRPGFDVLKTPDGGMCGVEDMCLKNASLLFCTTSIAGGWRVKESGPFDYAIVDEAAQLVEAETAMITQLTGLNQILLVGDPYQLQAKVTSMVSLQLA